VELGASAGLNLLWDRYSYDYGTGRRYGTPRSPVLLACTLRGNAPPPFPDTLPPVATRIGIDLDPIDVRDPEAALWLRALVWPDAGGRAELLQQAMRVARQDPPPLRLGDALDLLPQVLTDIPEDQLLCVFHTHTLNQLSVEARGRLQTLLAEHAGRRDLYRLSIEWLGAEHPRLEVVGFAGGIRTDRLLAHCGSHGEWLEWLGPSDRRDV
jgi:hypothetical protein